MAKPQKLDDMVRIFWGLGGFLVFLSFLSFLAFFKTFSLFTSYMQFA
jgi:hypothetical protein